MFSNAGHVPFPSLEGLSGSTTDVVKTGSPVIADADSNYKSSSSSLPLNQESHITASSSKLTSSDKLSALPALPHLNSRPRTHAMSIHPLRRSLDDSTSLPSPTSTERHPTHRHDLWHELHSHMHPHMTTSSQEGSVHSAPVAHQNENGDHKQSAGNETPQQRVSFESERHSAPARSISRAFSWMRSSDPSPPARRTLTPEKRHDSGSQPRDGQEINQHQRHHHRSRSLSQSQSQSRGTSPLRFLQHISSSLHHLGTHFEEPFVPVNPYKYRSRFPFCLFPAREDDLESGNANGMGNGTGSMESGAFDCEDIIPVTTAKRVLQDCKNFMTDTVPRELYLNLLLRLPSMYFSRVARIFEDAEISKPDIQRIIESSRATRGRGSQLNRSQGAAGQAKPTVPLPNVNRGHPTSVAAAAAANVGVIAASSVLNTPLPFPDEWTPNSVSPALIRFKHSWEAFIDSLVREWKTLNVVSALLASAILTMFQIPEAAEDPLTRSSALMSLICALLSLTYGCMYIVRFGQMRSMFHASRWAEEAAKTKTLIWWNVWVLLATPAIWLAWAMLWFISSILSFVWRTGSVDDPETRAPLNRSTALGVRIGITLALSLGMVYLMLIIRTLKQYGSHQCGPRIAQNAQKSSQDEAGDVAATEGRGRARDRRERGINNHERESRRGGLLHGLLGRPIVKETHKPMEMDIKVKQDVEVEVHGLAL